MTDTELVRILASWESMNESLTTLTEDQLKLLINYERSTRDRRNLIERMHQRYGKLRTARERIELMNGGML